MNLSRPRLCALLDRFAKVKKARRAWVYAVREVSFLKGGDTIASGDAYDDIVD